MQVSNHHTPKGDEAKTEETEESSWQDLYGAMRKEMPKVAPLVLPTTQDTRYDRVVESATGKTMRKSTSLLLWDSPIPKELAPTFFVVHPGEEPLANRVKVYSGINDEIGGTSPNWYLIELIMEARWNDKQVAMVRHFSKLVMEPGFGSGANNDKQPLWRGFRANVVSVGWRNPAIKEEFLARLVRKVTYQWDGADDEGSADEIKPNKPPAPKLPPKVMTAIETRGGGGNTEKDDDDDDGDDDDVTV